MRKLIPIVFICLWSVQSIADPISQGKDTVKNSLSINGMLSVTNNGFSYVPAFTLDAPAVFAGVNIEKNRLAFNTEFRYALSGRPWFLMFVTSYKVVNTPKTRISLGIHFPGVAFFETPVVIDGEEKVLIEAQQAFSPEINAGFSLSEHVAVGAMYMYFIGMGDAYVKQGHFPALWFRFAGIPITKDIAFHFNGQVFYLNMAGDSGYYVAWNLELLKKDFPLSLSSSMYKTITTEIAGKDFNWNVSLNYVFGKRYIEQ